MINGGLLRIKLEKLNGFHFEMSVEGHAGIPLPASEWFHFLFAWHQESFYGSKLEITDDETVPLSPWMALDFLGTAVESSLFSILWVDEADAYRERARRLRAIMEDGAFKPDFKQWQQGRNGWTATEVQLDEFDEGWLAAALSEKISSHAELDDAWQTILETYPLLEGTEHAEAIPYDEQGWLEKIGWLKSDVPFEVGLRLSEPDDEQEEWLLEIVLRDKLEPERLVEWNKWDSEAPADWARYFDRVPREVSLWEQVIPELLDGFPHDAPIELAEDEAWWFLAEGSVRLAEAGVMVLLPSWWVDAKKRRPRLTAQIKSSMGGTGRSYVGMNQLMDFDWRLSTGDTELSETEFLSIVEENRRLVNVRGKWIALDPAHIESLRRLMDKVRKNGLNFLDVLEHELIGQGDGGGDLDFEVEVNPKLAKTIESLLDVKSIPSTPVPENFHGELRPYQQQGLSWLNFHRGLGLGACLADDMGLGKTIQVIAYLVHLKEQGISKRPSIIICPTSVLGNWQKELERFAPELSVYTHYGQNRKKEDEFLHRVLKADVVLTSYGHVNQDSETLGNMVWSAIILDEAQNIKNAYTKQAKAVRGLMGDHKIALTGTPMENRLTELWSIFDFLNPGYFGSLNGFKQRFVAPIEKDNDQEKIRQLQQLVRPVLMRRTKQDEEVALNLPDKLEQKEYAPLTVEQASLYEQLVKDTFEKMRELAGFQRRGLILSMLSKLKQVCDHPALFLKEDIHSFGKRTINRSGKMELLVDLVRDIHDQQESCLIFTQFVGMGELIRHVLEKEFGGNVLFLHGGVSKAARDKMIEQFQDGKHSIFILSLKAGGVGLNLTAANHVIHYDRWWNPAVENQATDRAYRIGQKRFVHVHKLITTGTLEEKIDAMLERKQALNNEIIQSEQWITELTDEELHELFELQHS